MTAYPPQDAMSLEEAQALGKNAPRSLPAMTERQLQKCVMDAARECGWMCHHQTVALYSAAGLPDLVLCRPPRLIFAELKSDKGKLTEKQQEWLGILSQVPGLEVYVWRPADLDAVYNLLLPGSKRSTA